MRHGVLNLANAAGAALFCTMPLWMAWKPAVLLALLALATVVDIALEIVMHYVFDRRWHEHVKGCSSFPENQLQLSVSGTKMP